VLSLVVLLALVVGGVAAVVVPDLARSDEPTGIAVAPPTTGAGPRAPAPTEEPTTTGATTTTAGQTTTSATSTSTSTTSTVAPTPLNVSPRVVVLGPNAPRGTIVLANPRRVPVAWEAVASDLWFAVAPTGGTIKGRGRATIVVAYNPATVKPPAEGSVLITWDGGQATVPVRLPGTVPGSTNTTTTTRGRG
jgi:hypothetical protein